MRRAGLLRPAAGAKLALDTISQGQRNDMASSSLTHHSKVMAVEDGWIDANDHLNMAYYIVFFDRAMDDLLLACGLGPDYISQRRASYMAVEMHISYLREVFRTDPVRVGLRVLGVDDKRMHIYTELQHATDGWMAAAAEWMFLHTDLTTRRVSPWPADIRAALDAVYAAGASLPLPERVGRRIAMPRRP